MDRRTLRRASRMLRRRVAGWFGPSPPPVSLLFLFGETGAWLARLLPSRARMRELLGPGAPGLRAYCDREPTAARMRARGHEAWSVEGALRAPGREGTRRLLELLEESDLDRDVRAILVTPEFFERATDAGRLADRMRGVVEGSGAGRALRDGASRALRAGGETPTPEESLAPTILAPSTWIDFDLADRVLQEIRRPGDRAERFEVVAPGGVAGAASGAASSTSSDETWGPPSDGALLPVTRLGWRTATAADATAAVASREASSRTGSGSRVFLLMNESARRWSAVGALAASGIAHEIVVHAPEGEPLGAGPEGSLYGVRVERIDDLHTFLDRVFEECGGAGPAGPGARAGGDSILVTDAEVEPLPLLEASLRVAILGTGLREVSARARLQELEVFDAARVPRFDSTRELIAALTSDAPRDMGPRFGPCIGRCAPPPLLARDASRLDEGFAEWLGRRFGMAVVRGDHAATDGRA